MVRCGFLQTVTIFPRGSRLRHRGFVLSVAHICNAIDLQDTFRIPQMPVKLLRGCCARKMI